MSDNKILNSIRTTKSWIDNIFSFYIIKELFILNKLALPNSLAYILASFNKFICLVFAGHISSDKKFFDGSSIALSFTNVTGSAISIGLSSALATLCSQAYGAKQYRQCGLYYQKALFIHALLCFPLAALWLNLETILLILHQDPDVAKVAGQFISYFCLCLPAVQLSYVTLKLFQSHNLILPQTICNSFGILVNGIGQYFLVIHLQLGLSGCAMAFTASQYAVAVGYILYLRFSHLYQQTWGHWRLDAIYDWYQYFKYGIPGMLMLCFEWWAYEFGYFTVGAIAPYPKIELGIYSVLMNISTLIYSIPLGYMVAATVRIGNLLGQNEPNRARRSSYLSLCTILFIGFIQFVVMFFSRQWLSLLYTSDLCILAGSMWPVIVISVFQLIDGYQSVSGGIIKGCGKQKFGALINIITYGIVSLPLAFIFAFVLKWYTSGFWLGLGIGVFTQAIGYTIFFLRIDWNETADLAMKNAGLILEDKLISKVNQSTSHINAASSELNLHEEETYSSSEDNNVEKTNMKTQISNSTWIDEHLSQNESEVEDTNLLVELGPDLPTEESGAAHHGSNLDSTTFVFTIASRVLTLILCVLICIFGIIIREYHFTIPFQQSNLTNSSYCPYL